MPGSGIIYALTIRDAIKVSDWLLENGIKATAYHADLGNEERERLETLLIENQLKALVATVAPGMGFDKPDLGFVVHYQRQASVVHYYQQVGRAGRKLANAYGILLCGKEDDSISDYFIDNAFPPQAHIDTILEALDTAETGLTIPQLEKRANIRQTALKNRLKYFALEDPCAGPH